MQLPKNNDAASENAQPEVASIPGSNHVETTVSMMTGGTIRIFCDCALGRDHTYEEWVARLAPSKAVS